MISSAISNDMLPGASKLSRFARAKHRNLLKAGPVRAPAPRDPHGRLRRPGDGTLASIRRRQIQLCQRQPAVHRPGDRWRADRARDRAPATCHVRARHRRRADDNRNDVPGMVSANAWAEARYGEKRHSSNDDRPASLRRQGNPPGRACRGHLLQPRRGFARRQAICSGGIGQPAGAAARSGERNCLRQLASLDQQLVAGPVRSGRLCSSRCTLGPRSEPRSRT